MAARLNRALEELTLGPVPALHGMAEPADAQQGCGGGFAPAHRDDQADPSPATLQPFDPPRLRVRDIVAIHTRDGADYWRTCSLHGWASLPIVSRALAEREACPHCVAGLDGGRERYRELIARLAAGEAHAF